MKELSIEEKAKAYDEAIERAKSLLSGNQLGNAWIYKLLPELKESEDERIRKALLEYFGEQCDMSDWNGVYGYEVYAWLEKQGEHAKFLNNIQIGDKVTRNEDGVLVNLSQLKRVAKKQDKQDTLCYKCKKEQPSHSCQDITALGRCALEKQSEQKEDATRDKIAEYLKKLILDQSQRGAHMLDYEGRIEEEVEFIINIAKKELKKEKQGKQEPANKAEQKFEIGDLITNGILVGKIDEIHKWGYHAYFGDHYADVPDAENWHKWTIQDAKDGDVLSDGTTIFIFKDLLSDGSVMSYCDYDTDSGESDAFCPVSVNLMCSKITPATRGQRGALKKAMADAGYTFDFEKRELKKIEQKSVDKVEPKFKVGDFVKNTNYQGEPIYEIVYIDKECYICEYRGKENMGDKTVMHFAFDNPYLRLVEQNPAWSEEDERFQNVAINILNSSKVYTTSPDKYEDTINWLKSLKSRVQPKQEWSQNDIDMIDWLIRCCEKEHEELCNDKYGHQDIVSDLKRDCRKKWDWLESLKNRVAPQKQWKPSSEQIATIEYIIKEYESTTIHLYDGAAKQLYSLLEQLKQL